MLSPSQRILLSLLMIIIMLGMGCALSTGDFKNVIKSPKGILIALCSHYGWMPLIAFGLAYLFSLPAPIAVGLIIVGCAPAGTTSNLYAYYSRANLALSISTTVLSSILAVILMPIMIALYAKPFLEVANLKVPFKDIIATLIVILIPVALGIFIRSKSISWANKINKVSSVLGLATIVFLIAVIVPDNYVLFFKSGYEAILAALLLGLIGFALGYGLAKLTGLNPTDSRTVALETGIQNGPLVFSIIVLSFPEDKQAALLTVPLMYAAIVMFTAAIYTYILRYSDKKKNMAA